MHRQRHGQPGFAQPERGRGDRAAEYGDGVGRQGDLDLAVNLHWARAALGNRSGGSQLRLSQFFPGTPLGAALHRAHRGGTVIAGTSAGASIMSQFMISMGEEGTTPRQRTSQLTAGLGLVEGVIIDQHFGQRNRYGRLMSVVASSPHLLGIGIDENTAIEVTGSRFTVLGSGVVYVLDARKAVTDFPDARRGAPMLVSGAVIHSLPAGATFDLSTAALAHFVEKHPDDIVRAGSRG